MKKSIIILCIIVSTTFLTSCWSRREIDDLGFVLGVGISKTDSGLYSVVTQVANANALVSEGVTGKDLYTIIKAEGLTVFDATRNLSLLAKRRLYIPHIKSFVIHESVAKEGLGEVVSLLVQDEEIRLGAKVLISKTEPKEIFDTPNFIGIIPGMGLSIISENFGANNKIYIADLRETVESINNPVINYVTTFVEITPSPSEHELPELKLSQIAIFDGDTLVGYLDYEEGQAYNFITNNFTNGLIVLEYAENCDLITIEGLGATTDITPNFKDGKVSFHVDIKVDGNISERISTQDRPHGIDIEILQNQLNQVIEDKINKAIVNAQKIYGVDYYNFSKYFGRKYPRDFKELKEDWNEVFTNAQITVNVESTIIHSALNLNRGRI